MDEQKDDSLKPENENGNPPEEETWLQLVRSILFIFIGVFAFKHSILDANNIPSGSMVPTLKIGDYLFVNKMRYSFRLGISVWHLNLDYKVMDFDNPERGDIITFLPPNLEQKTYVKRVIALPGDDLKIVPRLIGKKGSVQHRVVDIYVNGELSPREIATEREVLSDLDMKPDDAQGITALSRLYWEQTGNQRHHTLYNFSASGDLGLFSHEYCVVKKPTDPPKERCGPIADDLYFVMGDSRDRSSDSRTWGFVDREKIFGKALIIYFSVNWRDKTCAYQDLSDLYQKFDPNRKSNDGLIQPYKLPPEEIDSHCYRNGNIIEPDADLESLSFGDKLKLMATHRIWRASVRWDRIGRIIH